MHERDLNTDFLLIILKNLLAARKDIKLILMSATLNARTFADYFKGFSHATVGAEALGKARPPLVEIPGRAHPVEAFYLEHVLEITGYKVDERGEYALKEAKGGKGKGEGKGGKGEGGKGGGGGAIVADTRDPLQVRTWQVAAQETLSL